MKADYLYRFGGAYDHWKTSDPADDLPDLPEVTEERAESLAECVINHASDTAIAKRLTSYYLADQDQYHQDREDYEARFDQYDGPDFD